MIINSTMPRFKFKLDYIYLDGRIITKRTGSNLVTVSGASNLASTYFIGGSQTTSWYVGAIKQQSFQNTCTINSGSSTLTVGTPVATFTGQQVTIYGAGAGGINLVTTIALGQVSASQVVTNQASISVTGATVVFGPALAISDTMSSHPNWTEIGSVDVVEISRQLWVGGSVVVSGNIISVDNSASPAIYTPKDTWYACGLFICNNSTLDGTAGFLYNESAFTQGAALVQSGSYTLRITAALQVVAQ